jgi:YggT family protein
MRALYFLIDTLIGLYQLVLLLRLLMQLTRADFRNPVARAIVQLTDPLILPLRRILPPLRRIDSASVAAILLVALFKVWVLQVLLLGTATPGVQTLLLGTLLDIIDLVLTTYLYCLFINAILSLVSPGNHSPVQSLLASICNPVLNPIRRYIPSVAGLDLSPLWASIAILTLLKILP